MYRYISTTIPTWKAKTHVQNEEWKLIVNYVRKIVQKLIGRLFECSSCILFTTVVKCIIFLLTDIGN